MIPVIICGGVGSKMWPASRQKSPKHFLPLINGKSLFQLNYEVLRKKFKPEEIFLQTNEVQSKIAMAQEPEIPEGNIFIEPEMRNHGPATGFAAAQLVKRGLGDEPFMLVQADVLRLPEEKFLEMMDLCDRLARTGNKYITGGIKPPYAIMGIDYLIRGEVELEEKGIQAFQVDKFVWRGTKEQVEEFIKDGRALTHSNHTCMTPKNMLEMYKKYKPEWYGPLMKIIEGAEVVEQYALMPKGPIEEVTQNAYNNGEALVVELPFEWIDFGTWESVDKYSKLQGWYKEERVISLDAEDNFVSKPANKTVAIIGLKNIVVVDTTDALLITEKSQTGRVGEIVDKLKEENNNELL